MRHAVKNKVFFRTLIAMISICYTCSFPLYNHFNEQPVDLSKIILHLQYSNNVFTPNTNIDDNAQSDSIRILKLIASINNMQFNTDDTSQDMIIIIELQTPHILYARNESIVALVKTEQVNFFTFPYASITSPPDTPPPMRSMA